MALSRSLARPLHPPCRSLSDIAPRTGDFQRAFDRRSPVRLRPSLRLSGDTGKLCVELSALFLSLAGRPLPARVPVCEWPRGLTAGRCAAAAVFAGLKEATAVIVRAAPRSPRGRAGHGGGGGKSKVGKGPQERNFRFNGQLRRRQQQRERHSIPRVRQSTSTQATDDENARPARHGGLHRGSYGRGAALGSIGCRVQCRYTPRVIRTPHVRVFSNPQLQ